jgi:hypothetical protein
MEQKLIVALLVKKLLKLLEANYHGLKSLPLFPILSQINPVNTVPSI